MRLIVRDFGCGAQQFKAGTIGLNARHQIRGTSGRIPPCAWVRCGTKHQLGAVADVVELRVLDGTELHGHRATSAICARHLGQELRRWIR